MDSVLKDRNENSTGSPALYISQLKADGNENTSSHNSKENHNPKSLAEIAVDSTRSMNMEVISTPTKQQTPTLDENSAFSDTHNDSFKENHSTENSNPTLLDAGDTIAKWKLESTSTSTPLNHKVLSRLASQESNNSVNNSYSALPDKDVPGLSFLLDGLNNMNLNTLGDTAASDDDEEFLSFNNNPVPSQQSSMMEAKKESEADKTFEAQEQKTQEGNITQTITEEEKSENDMLTKTADEEDKTPTNNQDNSSTNENQTETFEMAQNNEVKELNTTEVLEKMNDDGNLNKTEVLDTICNQENLNKTEVIVKEEELKLNDTVSMEEDQQQNLNLTEVVQQQQQNVNLTEVVEQQQQNVSHCELVQQQQHNVNLTHDLQQNLNLTEVVHQQQQNLNMTEVFQQQQNVNFTEIVHQQQQNVNHTSVIENIQPPVFEEIFNANAICSEDLEDVTMKSINETFEEKNSTKEQESRNVTQEEASIKNQSNDFQFAIPTQPTLPKSAASESDEMFTSASSYNFGDSDFDFLQKFGKASADDIGRDSVLLKFDPLFEKPVPLSKQTLGRLSEAKEEDSFSDLVLKDFDIAPQQNSFSQQEDHSAAGSGSFTNIDEFSQLLSSKKNAKSMSVDIMKDISSQNDKIDSNLECEDIKLSSINNEDQNIKLMEVENKLKMEAEQREEALLKRISEKDKQISKMNNVVEAYEKAIAELIAEKEQLIQSYEKKCNDLKGDSEMNAHHLASLESTFSDLHAKYERTKQIASELKEHEESMMQDRKTLQDNLKMQEARYEKMKTHAMSQLEIANNKLAEMLRNHQAEVTKLKAQLKKEEISRASVHEQLIQKSKENAELVKICDELIGNHGNSQNA